MSSDPKRLADYGDGLRGVVRDALDAERSIDDGEAARLARIEAKLLAALGAAPVLVAPPAAEAPPPPAETPAAPSPPAPSSWLGAKGAAAAGAAAIVIGAAFFLSRPTTTSPPVATVPSVPAAVETAPTAAPPTTAPPSIKTVSPSELPTAIDPPAKPAPSARETTGASATASGVTDTEEIALLARAHDALRGSPAQSLELCREHEKKFANGRFSQEREAVAIEALVHLGRRDEAEKRWSSFQTRFPGSSHRVHLESLFSSSRPGGPTNSAPPAR